MAETPQTPDEDAPTLEASEARETLARQEKFLYGRVVVGVVLYVAFATLDIVSALTHTVQDRATILLALLIGSIFALPRRLWDVSLLEALPRPERADWVDRTRRLQNWLASTRVIFFLGALFLFLGLPRLV